MESKNVGLVLSGGGHRGAAHAGAIKALEENGIFPNMISGTSAGALVGALYAYGYQPYEILEIFKKIKIFSFSRYARKKPGFVDTDSFYQFLIKYMPEDSFEILKKKLYITATDLVNGSIEVFQKGALISSILASASFPGIFTPVALGNSLYADGGILDNFPVDPIKCLCDEVYGVYVSPIKKMQISDFKRSYNVIDRAFHLRMHRASLAKFPSCDLVVYPQELSNHGLFSTNQLDKVFEIGYQSTQQELKKKRSELRFLEH
ncbi:patatin-like phospholipase family protein [Flavobacteriaceae bacterium 3-367]|uniref:patatin-like phospholipase family protein n=1 Tax=Eudoraea algarum TaxID=3417568 RepID=UPI00327E6328